MISVGLRYLRLVGVVDPPAACRAEPWYSLVYDASDFLVRYSCQQRTALSYDARAFLPPVPSRSEKPAGYDTC